MNKTKLILGHTYCVWDAKGKKSAITFLLFNYRKFKNAIIITDMTKVAKQLKRCINK